MAGQPSSSLRCVILGGRGFIGSAMAAEAARQGFSTTVVTREDYAAHAGMECDILINANGNSRKYLANSNPSLDFELSVQSVMRSLKDFAAKAYVYVSSIDVYPRADDPSASTEDTEIQPEGLPPYGLHKYQAELLVRRYAPAWLILRAGGMVGPGLWKNSVHDLLRNQPLRVHPDSHYQYLHTHTLARITMDLVHRNMWGQVLNTVGDGLLSPREIAGWIPGCTLRTIASDVRLEQYHVNGATLKALYPVPRTADTVRQFVADVLAGRQEIAGSSSSAPPPPS